jgi:hypothetical protein
VSNNRKAAKTRRRKVLFSKQGRLSFEPVAQGGNGFQFLAGTSELAVPHSLNIGVEMG